MATPLLPPVLLCHQWHRTGGSTSCIHCNTPTLICQSRQCTPPFHHQAKPFQTQFGLLPQCCTQDISSQSKKGHRHGGMVVWIQFNRFVHSKIDNDQAGHVQAGHLSLGLAQPLFGISRNLFTVMFYRLKVTICNVNDIKQMGQKVTRTTNNRWPGLRAACSPGHLVDYTAAICYYHPGLHFLWGICN